MDIQNIRWEITQGEYNRRKNNRFLFKALSFMFIVNVPIIRYFGNKISSWVLTILIILSFMKYFLGRHKYKDKNVLEYYEIRKEGIKILKSRENPDKFYQWSDLISYGTFDRIFYALSIFSSALGLDIFLIDKNNKIIYLKSNKEERSKIVLELSKKLKLCRELPSSAKEYPDIYNN